MTDWNQADPPEILRLWLSTDPLTLFQAVMLALGRDPYHTNTGRPDAYGAMLHALRQAIGRGELLGLRSQPAPDAAPTGDEHVTHVRQIDMRDWLRRIEYEGAFFFLDDPKDWPGVAAPVPEPAAPDAVEDKPDKPLRKGVREQKLRSDREENLLRIIRALLELAGAKKRVTTKQIESKLIALGFCMADKHPIPGDDVIGEAIKAARDLLPDTSPHE